ncbi:12062_t:CDS:2 [Entrophospora sp. SA101]|nr:12062_t:CDS:2 [Entrophospora sp. SA101]
MFCLSVLSAYLSQLTSVTLTHKLTTVFGIDIFKKSSGELSKDEERGTLDGDKQAYQHIDDLAWGRKGRLREVLDLKRVHKLVYDTRTLQSRTADPHSAYKIPLAPTLYTPPKYRIIKKIKWPKKKRPYRKVIRYTITTQLGYKLWRVRGWKQPTWISMMMNKRIIKHQKHVDKYQELLELLDIARHEQRFMRSLDPNLEEEAKGFDELVLQEMKIHKRYYDNMMKIREKTGFDD